MVDYSEKSLETILVSHLRDVNGYVEGTSADYAKDVAIVKPWLEAFLQQTQPKKVAASKCFEVASERVKFYNRLSDELGKYGVTHLLRNGFRFNGVIFDLYYLTPSAENHSAKALYEANCFGVIRQLHFSAQRPNDSIDVVTFINGLPIATFELKNHYTGQTVEHAVNQYKTDRDPKEVLLRPKRCAVHFAVDDTDVKMCTALAGKESWFLPFNRGYQGGAGNPPIPGKTMTSYLWEAILTKSSLSNIIEHFAKVVEVKDKKGKTKERVIWPRYHQLDAVRRLIAETTSSPVGRKFLVQHSAGSGKSNTITWLAYQLVLSRKFNSVLVVTDQVTLDRQIRDNLHAFAKLQNVMEWADDSAKLRQLLQSGKPIIVTTVHKFSFIMDEIGASLKDRSFAVVIDEAHSSQSGTMASNMAASISGLGGAEDGEDLEAQLLKLIQSRKLATNANYYAFTATPKNKTLETFGEARAGAQEVQYVPFHEYTMKQAIEEGFILDVLQHYTPYRSYYEVMKKVEEDPEFDKKKSAQRLRTFVESRPETIEKKSAIIVEHFCTKVFSKIGGKARAMVVTSSIERAIQYFHTISKLLKERKSPYKAIVAFTDKEIDGQIVTESSLNGFPSAQIESKMEEEPYRLLVVADKFQTGYDQPLLHTMYVDKQLSGLKAVQTLSRLNRAHPKKYDTFVLDFANEIETIQTAFQQYYKTTILDGASDINKLNDLINEIEEKTFYTLTDRDQTVALRFSSDAEARSEIDACLDAVVARFKDELSEDDQIHAKSAMKNYCRIYPFFAAIMPYESEEWERYYLFYVLLVRKLPKLKGEDFTKGLCNLVDLDKYRLQRLEEVKIQLENQDAAVSPVPVGFGGGKATVELDALSSIIKDFNDAFGGIEWRNEDEVIRQIQELPKRIVQDDEFAAALRHGDAHIIQIQFNDTIKRAVASMGEEKVEFMQHYFCNEAFRNFVNGRVFASCQKQNDVLSKTTTHVSTPTHSQLSMQIPTAVVDEDETYMLQAAGTEV